MVEEHALARREAETYVAGFFISFWCAFQALFDGLFQEANRNDTHPSICGL